MACLSFPIASSREKPISLVRFLSLSSTKLILGTILGSIALLLYREHFKRKQKLSLRQAIFFFGTTFISNTIMTWIGSVSSTQNTTTQSMPFFRSLQIFGYLTLPILAFTLLRIQLGCFYPPFRIHKILLRSRWSLMCFIYGQFILVAFYWTIIDLEWEFYNLTNLVARVVYAISVVYLVSCLFGRKCRDLLSRNRPASIGLLTCILPPALLLSGKLGCLVITANLWQLIAFSSEIFKRNDNQSDFSQIVLFCIVGHYTALLLFFSTEHLCEFSGLHFTAGFVGLSEFDFYGSGILLGLETFSGFLIVPFVLPSLSPSTASTSVLAFLSISRAYFCLLSMLSANFMRRHLWTIKTFAPKFVFEAGFLMVSDITILLRRFWYILET